MRFTKNYLIYLNINITILNTVPKKLTRGFIMDEKNKNEDVINRKNFFIKVGKYSAAASALFAGATHVFSGCDPLDILDDDDDDAPTPTPVPDYVTDATTISLESATNTVLNGSSSKSYKILISSTDTYKIMIGEGEVVGDISLELYNGSGSKIWSLTSISSGSEYDITGQLTSGTYYLVVKSAYSASCAFDLTFAEETYSEWTNNVWSDSSWSNANWTDIGTGTWYAHSDTWYAGEWSNGWQNFAYY